MELTNKSVALADKRAAAKKAACPAAIAVRYEHGIARLMIVLASGLELALPLARVQGLEDAQPAMLAGAEISPSGLGVHFPHIDVDLYIPALLEGFLGSKRWLAAENGKRGGSAATAAKAAAARQNGKRGGRPRKTAEPAAA